MKVLAANQVSEEKVEEFVQTTDQIEKESLITEGYVVEFEEEIKGCFVLASVDEEVYWLKQLYITKEQAANLPVLLETIVTMAKGMEAKKLYVHSHQPLVDMLLDAMQFSQQKDVTLPVKKPRVEGNWWAYDVS